MADKKVPSGKTITVEGVRFYPKPIQKPHPPIVVGGTSELALKRTVRYGDGWYGIAKSLDEARALIDRLRELARDANRPTPVEITLSLRTGKPVTLDDVKRLGELGVDRALVGMPLRAFSEDELARFRDEIMTRI